jgi:hypothetical protein
MASLREWHGFEDSVRWRLVPEGVEVEGSGVERTRGRPAMAARVWDAFGDAINQVCRTRQVPCPLLVATICTESGGDPDAVRLEPGYVSDEATPGRVSVGLTQTLISTARDTMRMSFGRDWLRQPGNAVDAGAGYIARQAKATRYDPPLVAAAYNAGRLAHQNGERNRWKLRQFPIGTPAHCDRFVRFYNDAVAVMAAHPNPPAVPHSVLLGGDYEPPAVSTAPPPRYAEAAGRTPFGEARVDFGEGARREGLTPYSLKVLKEILRAAALRRCVVSSTQRSPAEQARVMFDNLERYGVEHQKRLYARPGREVVDAYAQAKARSQAPEQVREAMVRRILAVGPTRVSRHASDPAVLNVFDVAPSSITDRVAFETAVRAERRVSFFLTPPRDPGYHLEIPQPGA